MNIKLFAAASVAFLVVAGGAAAGTLPVGVTSLTPVSGDAIPVGEQLITDFNSTGGTGPSFQGGTINDLANGFHFVQSNALTSYTRDGFAGLDSGVSAPPPLDNPDPAMNPTEGTNPVQAGSFYETVLNNGSATLTSDKGLSQFSFYMGSPDDYNHITFTSTGNSFEFDKLAGIAVPEPATWAMMIMGFGLAGGMVRAKRRAAVAA